MGKLSFFYAHQYLSIYHSKKRAIVGMVRFLLIAIYCMQMNVRCYLHEVLTTITN